MNKQWLALTLGVTLAIGMLAGSGLQSQANQVVIEPGWRYSDGYWNYYDADDKTWYHTDGKYWYGYADDGWTAYKFDKNFGKKTYREGYTVPVPGGNIVVPGHKIKVKVK